MQCREKKVTQHGGISTLCRKIQVLDLHPPGGGLLLRGVRGVPGPEDDPAGEKRRRAAGGVLLRPADQVLHARQQVRELLIEPFPRPHAAQKEYNTDFFKIFYIFYKNIFLLCSAAATAPRTAATTSTSPSPGTAAPGRAAPGAGPYRADTAGGG